LKDLVAGIYWKKFEFILKIRKKRLPNPISHTEPHTEPHTDTDLHFLTFFSFFFFFFQKIYIFSHTGVGNGYRCAKISGKKRMQQNLAKTCIGAPAFRPGGAGLYGKEAKTTVKAGVGGSFPLSGSVPAQVVSGKEAKTTVKAGLAASFPLSGSVPAQVVC
jgi:hypothetical protein